MNIKRIVNYQGNEDLLAEMADLIAPSYARTGAHIQNDIKQCEELYTLRDEHAKLAAFFMVDYHDLASKPCCYLGLSAVRQDCKGQGLASRLYHAFLADCRLREQVVKQRILLYFTTATPLVFNWWVSTLEQVAPTSSGQCASEALGWLQTIAQAKYPTSAWQPDMPYLLRGAATSVRYSDREYKRITELAAQQPSNSFFNAVALDERNGDRLLVVGYAPEE